MHSLHQGCLLNFSVYQHILAYIFFSHSILDTQSLCNKFHFLYFARHDSFWGRISPLQKGFFIRLSLHEMLLLQTFFLCWTPFLTYFSHKCLSELQPALLFFCGDPHMWVPDRLATRICSFLKCIYKTRNLHIWVSYPLGTFICGFVKGMQPTYAGT